MKPTNETLNHYIVPIGKFNIYSAPKEFEFIFDENLMLILKHFSYEDDMERVDSDYYSNFDQGQLKMKYSWGLRFDCDQTELDTYTQNINLLMLTFRIFDRADCSFEYILNVSDTSSSKRILEKWKRSINTIEHLSTFTIDTLKNIKEGYLKLQRFYSVSARTKHSIQFLYLGYISYYWMQGFVLLMTSLETLVSPDIKSAKITSIIINRIIKIIPDKSICSKNQLNKIYELRSDIIHGKIISNLQLSNEMPHIVRLQQVVLSVFNNILNKNLSTIYSNKMKFEKFFCED